MTARVVVVRPGLASYGERRRTETWTRLANAAGAEVTVVPVLQGGRRPRALHRLPANWIGRDEPLVPEALAWPVEPVLARVAEARPDLVILQTARCYRPELSAGPWVTVLDLVDRLSESYRQRARLSGAPTALLYGRLARAHARFEQSRLPDVAAVVAAGRQEADELGVAWIPNLVAPSGGDSTGQDSTPAPRPEPAPHRFDAVFFGSLGYRPNVEALTWLGPASALRPDLDILVAGHRPTAGVRQLCADQGWHLVEDYPSEAWLCSQAAVAITPLRSTCGIQNKVLDAARVGLAQVVTPAALAGIGDFPAVVADDPHRLLAETAALVQDPDRRVDLAERARRAVDRRFTPEPWVRSFRLLAGWGKDTVAREPAVTAPADVR